MWLTAIREFYSLDGKTAVVRLQSWQEMSIDQFIQIDNAYIG